MATWGKIRMLFKQQTTQANYGIDGPNVILVFYSLTLLFLSVPFLSSITNILPFSLTFPALFCAFGFFLLGSSMVYTSKVGKIRFANEIVKSINLKGSEKVLDIGCGRGLYVMTLAKHLKNGKSFGLDIWRKMDQSGNRMEATLSNARAENVAQKVEIVDGDMRNIPFEKETFDLIISSMAIHNIPSKEGRDQAIREIARVAKDQIVLMDYLFVKKYAAILRELGWKEIKITKTYRTFPPYGILRAKKPAKSE